jgi:valyl-tRNA synthetase
LEWQPETVLAAGKWPEILVADAKRAKAFEDIKVLVADARAVMKAIGVQKTNLFYRKAPVVAANKDLVARLAHLDSVTEQTDADGVKLTQTKYDTWLDISKEQAAAYVAKLEASEQAEAEAIKRLEIRLGNKQYVSNAPEALVAQTREQLEDAKARLKTIKAEAASFRR